MALTAAVRIAVRSVIPVTILTRPVATQLNPKRYTDINLSKGFSDDHSPAYMHTIYHLKLAWIQQHRGQTARRGTL